MKENSAISEVAAVIPVYNNERTVESVISSVLEYCSDVIVVNDGCTDGTADILKRYEGKIKVLTHPFNYGKGAALLNAMKYAAQEGFKYLIAIDADGQHSASDIPAFLEKAKERRLVVGARNIAADGMPRKSTFANKFSNFWYKLETGVKLSDTQSGFRMYPVQDLNLEKNYWTSGYEFELEILVAAAWQGLEVCEVPVSVWYPPEEERVSHFRPFRDFMRITILNTILVFYCLLWRWPVKFLKMLTLANIRKFIYRYIVHSPESNCRLAASAGLGVFTGILPVWGYQMVVAFGLAHYFKLNKVVTVAASNISLPPFIPFILYYSYRLGCFLTRVETRIALSDISFDNIGMVVVQYAVGAIVLALGMGLATWAISYLCMVLAGRKR